MLSDICLKIILITIILKVKKKSQTFKLKHHRGRIYSVIFWTKFSTNNVSRISNGSDTFTHRKELENDFNKIFGPLKFR